MGYFLISITYILKNFELAGGLFSAIHQLVKAFKRQLAILACSLCKT